MAKIEKLTPEQEKRLEEYFWEWLAIGRNTQPCDRPKAEAAVTKAYEFCKLKVPEFVWVDNMEQAEELINKSLKKTGYNGTSYWGQFESYWVAYYLFGLELDPNMYEPKDKDALLIMAEICRTSFWWYPYSKVCIMVERPERCEFLGEQLHCDGGPAFKMRNGTDVTTLYYLHDVEVPKEVACTPAEMLSAKMVMTERNAEVRREIVRKIGIEKVCKELTSEVVDKEGEYELLLLDIGDNRKRPFLKMLNPSIGTYHIEGVEPNIRTVKAALAWRNGLPEWVPPSKLT